MKRRASNGRSIATNQMSQVKREGLLEGPLEPLVHKNHESKTVKRRVRDRIPGGEIPPRRRMLQPQQGI